MVACWCSDWAKHSPICHHCSTQTRFPFFQFTPLSSYLISNEPGIFVIASILMWQLPHKPPCGDRISLPHPDHNGQSPHLCQPETRNVQQHCGIHGVGRIYCGSLVPKWKMRRLREAWAIPKGVLSKATIQVFQVLLEGIGLWKDDWVVLNPVSTYVKQPALCQPSLNEEIDSD